MLNESKIRLMTKLTLSEEHQEKESGKADSYYKADYIHLKVLTTIICVTVAFLLIFFLVACYHMEDLLAELFQLDYKKLGLKILGAYVCLVVIYVVYVVIDTIFSTREDSKRRSNYMKDFKALRHLYEKEEGTRGN